MLRRTLLVAALALSAASAGAAEPRAAQAAAKAAIATSILERIGASGRVDVEIVQAPSVGAEAVAADVLPGARFGTPSRFMVTFANGRKSAVVARVTGSAVRPVAARPLDRDAVLAEQDIDWVEGTLAGQPVSAFPSPAEIAGSRTRRLIARGEIITGAVLQSAQAVRAGDVVTLVIRRGPVEVRGEGRAVNSGSLGDTVRVLRPGKRQPLQGRLVAPAVVEIFQ